MSERIAIGPGRLDGREQGLLAAFALGAWALFYLPGVLGSYGYFIDEFYYAACAARPAWGYVDHPPLAPVVLALTRGLLGDSLWALRLVPALAGAATVVLTMLLARRLGAGVFGQCLAAGCLLAASVPQIMFGMFSMNAFSMPIWLGCCWLLVEIEARDEPRLWLAFGALAGVGLENKHTIVLLAAGLAVGLLLTPARRHFRGPWLWAGAGLALLIASPNLAWQAAHGWPSLEFYRNASLYKNLDTPPHMVVLFQVLTMNPGTVPVWLAGAYFFLRAPEARRWRHLGWIFVALFALIVASGSSRPDRITPIYPVMFAAGGALLDALGRRRPWVRWAAGLVLAVNGLVLLPVGTPILPPRPLAAYVAKIGVVPQIEAGEGKTSPLPQWFADRTGWEEFARDVEAAVAALTPEERASAVIFAPSYGQAGAIELLLAGRGMPPVYSGHNSYFLWGPPRQPFSTAIFIGWERELLETLFAEVTLVSTHHCDLCMRWRDGMPFWIARGPRRDVAEIWPEVKHFE
ncbi:MAG: glycosyltransferase family 39 protein [Acidobacteriota bacterium]|nr:glycosyltransferase family 39 protein [Acidobacteriota bacterium]